MVMPAVETRLQRGTLVKQHAESFENLKFEIIHPTSCSKIRTTSSEPVQWSGRTAEEPQSAIRNQQSNLKPLRLSKPRSALHVFTKRNHESDSVSIYRGRNQFGNRGAVW